MSKQLKRFRAALAAIVLFGGSGCSFIKSSDGKILSDAATYAACTETAKSLDAEGRMTLADQLDNCSVIMRGYAGGK